MPWDPPVTIAVLAMMVLLWADTLITFHKTRFAYHSIHALLEIFSMREVHLGNVDLNLLDALCALLEERHVTRAAKRPAGTNASLPSYFLAQKSFSEK